LQLENWTTLVCIVYVHGTSQKSNDGDNGLICKVTLSLGLFSPPIPSFQWYLQSKEIFIKSSDTRTWLGGYKSLYKTNTGRYKDNNSLGSMTCCKFVRDLKKSRNPGRWCHPNIFILFFLKLRQVICREDGNSGGLHTCLCNGIVSMGKINNHSKNARHWGLIVH